MASRLLALVALSALLVACGDSEPEGCSKDTDCLNGRICEMGACVYPVSDAGSLDAGPTDASPTDIDRPDEGVSDLGPLDRGIAELGIDAGEADATVDDLGIEDLGTEDLGMEDLGTEDLGTEDLGTEDLGTDAGPEDATVVDVGIVDVGTVDLGSPDADTDAGSGVFDAGLPPPGIGTWEWAPIANSASRYRFFSTVWTGAEMIVTGGRTENCAGNGLAYNPATNTWRNTTQPPRSSSFYPSVWTGLEVLMWSGNYCGLGFESQFDGGALNPWTNASRLLPTAGSPGALGGHQAFWTGMYMLIWGGACDALSPLDCGGPDDIIGRYDPIANAWIPTTGSGAPDARFGAAVWTGLELLVYQDATKAARYDPLLDMWSPITVPAQSWMPTGQKGLAVWTGDRMIVWDGTTGATYDPATDQWSPISLIGAPAGTTLLHMVWTGAEVIVIGASGGGHYNPTTDEWRAIETKGAFLPSTNDAHVLWTGSDLIIYHGLGISPARGARYGPKITGDLACNGGAAPLEVAVSSPTTRAVAPTTINLTGQVTNTYSVSRIEWQLDGNVVANTQNGTLDTSALTPGTYNLRLEAEDVQGNVACLDRTLFVDRPPASALLAPPPNGTADPTIRVRASCQDDWNLGCRLVLRRQGAYPVLAIASDNLDTVVDLSAFRGQTVQLIVDAYDGRHQKTTRTVDVVVVETNARLTRHTEVPGVLCDYSATEALYLAPGGTPLIRRDLASGTEDVVDTAGRSIDCVESRLVTSGVVTKSAGTDEAVYWNGTQTTVFPAINVSIAGDSLLAYSSGRRLTRYDLGVGSSELISTSATPLGHQLADNGTALWVDTSYDVRLHPPGGPDSAVISAAEVQHMSRTDGTNVAYRTRQSSMFGINGWNGATLPLVALRAGWPAGGPVPERHYATSGGYFAWAVPDALGVLQVWRRTPGGTTSIVTGFGDDTDLWSLGALGQIVYGRGGALYYVDGAISERVGPDLVVPRWIGGSLYVRYGNDAYLFTP